MIRSILAGAAIVVGLGTLGVDLAQAAYSASQTARVVVLARG